MKKHPVLVLLCILTAISFFTGFSSNLLLKTAKEITSEKEKIRFDTMREEASPDMECKILDAVWQDASYFPVPASSSRDAFHVSFENSWMAERVVGGKRGHEGCDIMPEKDIRGYYPVISTSDGIVEKVGWLRLGGYRIGIRSKHGVYFYYAHMSEYAQDFQPGDSVTAGTLLGFMGDTGYSEVEGTVGNFPVHLHFGIYLTVDGNEVSINPYYLLKNLEKKKLKVSE